VQGKARIVPAVVHAQFLAAGMDRIASGIPADALGSAFHTVGQQVADALAPDHLLHQGHDGIAVPPGKLSPSVSSVVSSPF
jgi:hypothetical protein